MQNTLFNYIQRQRYVIFNLQSSDDTIAVYLLARLIDIQREHPRSTFILMKKEDAEDAAVNARKAPLSWPLLDRWFFELGSQKNDGDDANTKQVNDPTSEDYANNSTQQDTDEAQRMPLPLRCQIIY